MRALVDWLKEPERRRFLKFCVVGASGVPVNLLFTWLGYRLLFTALAAGSRNGASFLLGIAVSILTNFLLNDIWTWGDRDKTERSLLGRLLRFYVVCSAASLIQFGVAMALSLWIGPRIGLASSEALVLGSQLVGIVLATLVNFAANNLWTFRSREPSEAAK